jgi:hypothetical protein
LTSQWPAHRRPIAEHGKVSANPFMVCTRVLTRLSRHRGGLRDYAVSAANATIEEK